MFYQESQSLVKVAGKNNENQFLHFKSILTTGKRLLISADDSYQMVSLCDENEVLFSDVKYL